MDRCESWELVIVYSSFASTTNHHVAISRWCSARTLVLSRHCRSPPHFCVQSTFHFQPQSLTRPRRRPIQTRPQRSLQGCQFLPTQRSFPRSIFILNLSATLLIISQACILSRRTSFAPHIPFFIPSKRVLCHRVSVESTRYAVTPLEKKDVLVCNFILHYAHSDTISKPANSAKPSAQRRRSPSRARPAWTARGEQLNTV